METFDLDPKNLGNVPFDVPDYFFIDNTFTFLHLLAAFKSF